MMILVAMKSLIFAAPRRGVRDAAFRDSAGVPRLFHSLAVVGSFLASGSATAVGVDRAIAFESHATFFSREMRLRPVLDPHVFVTFPGAAAGVGPQGIVHVAGFRNALLTDPQDQEIATANGAPLSMTLRTWLGAGGKVVLSDLPGGNEIVTVTLRGLKPAGHYSLFVNHFDQDPVGFTPLDGTAGGNDFVAGPDGCAVKLIISPIRLAHKNAVLVVYHSDGQFHGLTRGDIGINAHHQLVARP